MTRPRAILFDVDGTLIDAIEGQRRAWSQWAAEFGLDAERVYELALRTRPAETAGELLPAELAAAAVERFDELEDWEAHHGELRGIAGAAALLESLDVRRWGLVTSNAEARVRRRFERLGLPIPRVVVDNRATKLGKPNPDPYLLGAERLGVPPAACLVIEDSPSGVAAGLAAGMTVWCVNRAEAPEGVHRSYPSLAAAASDIRQFIEVPKPESDGPLPVGAGLDAKPAST